MTAATMTATTESLNMAPIIQTISWKDTQPWLITVYFSDIGHPCYDQYTRVKQGIHWPVSIEHIAGSSLQLVEVTCFLQLTADRVLVFDWIAGSCLADCWKQGGIFLKVMQANPGLKVNRIITFFFCANVFFLLLCFEYIYLINKAQGPYWENIGPRSWEYGPIAARSVQKRRRADILPVGFRERLVNRRFITRLKKVKTAKTQVRDHSGQSPVRYLENIGPAIEHFDWLILVIGPLTAWVV